MRIEKVSPPDRGREENSDKVFSQGYKDHGTKEQASHGKL